VNTEVKKHLAFDPVLIPLLHHLDTLQLVRDPNIYIRLMRAIVGQQLSVKAASTIWERFIGLYPGAYPAAEAVLATSPEDLRKCGLSAQKGSYIQNIAAFSMQNRVDNEHLNGMDNEEIIRYLTQIKGVGRWTVEMILMFALGREDVFPMDDLGVRNAMLHLYGVQASGRQQKAELERIASRWAPYRSYACMVLWKWKDNPAL